MSQPLRRRLLAPAALLSCALTLAPALAAEPADQLAQQLIALRAEVEALNAELAIVREENRTTMAGLSAQKAELEASLARQQLALRQVSENLAEREAAAEAAGVASDVLKPILLEAADRLDRQIAAGVPFKQAERRASLKELRDQLETDKLPAPRAANRLWAFLEDEFRLTRDNAIQRQTIELGGETMLADVAKLGTVMMFFRTDDQRLGSVQRSGQDWSYVQATDKADIDRIAALFDALDKQIRQGFFELPNALLSGGAK